MKLKDLQERRALVVAEMRSLTDKPAGNGGDLSEEQAKRFDVLKAELETVERGIARQALLDEAERRTAGAPIAGSGDDRFDQACREFSLRRAICMSVPDLAQRVDCGREREISDELARRAGRAFNGIAVPMSIFLVPLEKRVMTGAGEGANIIATDLRGDQFIDSLRAALVVRRLGARILSGLIGNLDLPKISTSVAASWVADNAAITAADPDLTKVSLSPKHAGMITEFSRSTLLQSSPDVEQLLRMDFAKVLANAIDSGALKGGGSNQPSGVITTSGVTDRIIGTPTWAEILDMIATVETNNALAGSLGWAMAPRVKKVLRSTLRAASTDSRMLMEAERELAGYPAFSTGNLAGSGGSPSDGELIFGNWDDLVIGFWSELDVLVNPYESTAYSKGNVQVRGMMTADVALRHTESFVFSNDVDTV